jgi:hypothetical protein
MLKSGKEEERRGGSVVRRNEMTQDEGRERKPQSVKGENRQKKLRGP